MLLSLNPKVGRRSFSIARNCLLACLRPRLLLPRAFPATCSYGKNPLIHPLGPSFFQRKKIRPSILCSINHSFLLLPSPCAGCPALFLYLALCSQTKHINPSSSPPFQPLSPGWNKSRSTWSFTQCRNGKKKSKKAHPDTERLTGKIHASS